MDKIIAKYEMMETKGYQDRYYEYEQKVSDYRFDCLRIPNEYCFRVVIQPVEQSWFTDREIISKKGPIEKIFYIGKEISLEELKEKYGNHPTYQYFTKRAEEQGFRIVIDRMGRPQAVGTAAWERDEIIEIVEM